jgi:hypothetical protein
MKRKNAWFAFFIFLTGALVDASIALAEPVTIEGLVTDTAQIVTDDGEVYDLAETRLCKAVAELVGMRVSVTGEVENINKRKIITVEEYLIIDENERVTMRYRIAGIFQWRCFR